MRTMKRAKNLRELEDAFSEVKSGVAEDTIWSAKALLYLCEHGPFNGEFRDVVSALKGIRADLQGLRRDTMAQRRVEELLAARIEELGARESGDRKA